MKTNVFFFFAAILFLTSCSKDDDTPNNPPAEETYINTTSGSTWTYHEKNSSGTTPIESDYTITSTSKDSSIGSKSYHVYNYSFGGSQYLNISGHDYYQFDSLPGLGKAFDRLYLKDNVSVDGTWAQNISFTVNVSGFPLSLTVTVTNKVAEKGSRTVNGKDYADVIHVSSSLSSTAIPTGLTSSIDSYYSPKYGLIENTTVINLDYLGITQKVNLETKLVSAVLK